MYQLGPAERVGRPCSYPNSSLPSSLLLSPYVLTTEEAAGVRLRVVTGNTYSDIARPSSG
jgi:hypothetical protein